DLNLIGTCEGFRVFPNSEGKQILYRTAIYYSIIDQIPQHTEPKNHAEWISVDLKELTNYDMTDSIRENMSIILDKINKKFRSIRNAESKKRSAEKRKLKEIEGSVVESPVVVNGVSKKKKHQEVKHEESSDDEGSIELLLIIFSCIPFKRQIHVRRVSKIFLKCFALTYDERIRHIYFSESLIKMIDIEKHVLFHFQKCIDNEKMNYRYSLIEIEKIKENWFWFKNQNTSKLKRKMIKRKANGEIYCIIDSHFPSKKFHLYDKRYVRDQHKRICDRCHKFLPLIQTLISNIKCNINCIIHDETIRIEKENPKNLCCQYRGMWRRELSCDNCKFLDQLHL
ncbi:8352_t:CDS:2, partial [Cetraspora pellucida]